MHLEAVTPAVRQRIMPGKAEISVERYLKAFAAAVPVFGRGQVSTYILAGLGDTADAILAICETLVGARRLSVRRAVRADLRARRSKASRRPRAAFMHAVLGPLARMLAANGLSAADIKAGCGKCGACSALSTYERRLAS